MSAKEASKTTKLKVPKMRGVLNYVDFHTFIKDFVEAKKASKSQWSYKVWAAKLALSSPSTLIMIANGQRNPSAKLVERMVRYFKFSEAESEHFRDLIQLNKSKGNIRLGIEVMQKIDKSNSWRGVRLLDYESFSAISNWYYYALRELVNLKGFEEDPAWIRERLQYKVSTRVIVRAIETLLNLGLLQRNRHGKLEYADGLIETVDTPHDVTDEGLKRFHLQSAEHMALSLENVSPQERHISGAVFALNYAQMDQAKDLIRKFQRDMCLLLEAKNADAVYQLEVGFFPLALTPNIKGITR